MSRRTTTVRTVHDNPGLVAAGVQPDNTDEMTTEVEGDAVVTRIERTATGGLATTVDDYLANLQVADGIAHERPQTEDTNYE